MQIEQPIANYNGNPKVEDGYTKIANELLDAILLFDFSERQYKIVFAIIRKTYGYNKKQDDISLSQLSAITKIPNNHVSSIVSKLVEMNVIIKNKGKFANVLSINKAYDSWGVRNTSCLNTSFHNMDFASTSVGVLGVRNTSLQKTTPKDKPKDICAEVLNYLNSKANKNYKPVKANTDFINARIKDGFTKEDLFRVIDSKCSQWLMDDKMNQYLRPATLFNATKFSQYAGELSSNKPVNKDLEGML